MKTGAFSPEETRIFDQIRGGNTLSEIAFAMGRSLDSVRWHSRKNGHGAAQSRFDWPLPVKPIAITLPATRPEPRTDGAHVSVHYGDVHFPFQDDRALSILYQVIADVKPNLVVNHGDLLDSTQISKHEKDPSNRVSLQREIDLAGEHLGIIASLVPEDTTKWLVTGNHEDRLRRLLWDMQQDHRVRELMQLNGVQEVLTWANLLDVETTGFEVFEERQVLFDKLVVKHGDFVRKWSGLTAKEEYAKYGKSGISGHTHRRGVFEHRDWNGTHAWWETGCLCDLNPQYVSDPDWQQGFLVVTFNEDKTNFGVEEVRIHSGIAFFRGKEYRG